METLLWAVDLVAVVYLCFWAVAQDSGKPPKKKKGRRNA
jgi:hypothetical protein